MKTIGTCEQCRYWGVLTDYECRSCDHPSVFSVSRGHDDLWHSLDDVVQTLRIPMSVEVARNAASEGRYKVNFGPEFGCIHWEAKHAETEETQTADAPAETSS